MAKISGFVYDSSGSAAAGRTVRAYRRDTGALLGSTTTGDGTSTTFASEVGLDTPVVWYRMAETSGTTATNAGSAGSGGNGTYTGGVTLNQSGFVTGGSSVLLDGSVSAGRIVSSHVTNYTSACTLMAYINPSATNQATNDIAYIVSKDQNNAGSAAAFPISLTWRPSTTKLEFRLSKGNDFNPDLVLASGTLSPGASYLVHAVYRANGSCELYVDGALVASSTIAFTISSSGSIPWVVGCATPQVVAATALAFAGRIGEAAIFSTALSATRIAKHNDPSSGVLGAYSIDTGSFTGECNVIALDDVAGTTENDLIIRTTGV